MYVSGSVRFSFGTIRTNVRIFFLIFLCNCKIKFYICITKTSLSYGVMVTQQILVLLFLVRIQVAQHRKPAAFRLRVFRFLPLMPPLPHPCAGAPDRRSSPQERATGVPQERTAGFPRERATGFPRKRAIRTGTCPPDRHVFPGPARVPRTDTCPPDRHTQIERQATLSLYPIRPDIGPSRSADRSPAPLTIDKSMPTETGWRTGKKEQKKQGFSLFWFTK